MRKRARTVVVGVLTLLLLVGGSLAGSTIALRAAGPATYQTDVAAISVEVRPAWDGGIDVFVPLVDWGAEMHPFDAPLEVQARIETINRAGAREAVASGANARAALDTVREQSTDIVRRSLRRAALVAIAGGALGGALAGALLAALRLRRRFLLVGIASGVAVSGACVALSLNDIRSPDVADLNTPTFYARGDELPRLLSFSGQVLDVGDDYAAHYTRALASLTNLLATTSTPITVETDAIFVASDIHNNELVLPAFERYTQDRPVLLVGDYGQLGGRPERRLAPRLARLGSRVVAVSGNHDSAGFMTRLDRSGIEVLGRDGGSSYARVGELLVAGYRDPLESRRPVTNHVLRVYGARYEQQVDDFIAWFEALPQRPDVVLVHQHGFAHRLVRHLDEAGDDRRLVVMTGHDHKAHLEQVGAHVIVDGGTLGAGGPAAIGEQSASFAQAHFEGRTLRTVDVVEVEPVSGAARARRIVVEPAG